MTHKKTLLKRGVLAITDETLKKKVVHAVQRKDAIIRTPKYRRSAHLPRGEIL